MKKTIKIAKLAEFEQKRFEEVDFYLKIIHLFKVFGQTQETYELIELICQACGASITVIKTMTSNLLAANSVIRPSQWELIILMYRNNETLEDISKCAKVSYRTIYRKIEEYNKLDGVDSQFFPRIKEDYHPHIAKFNKKLKELMTYDGYTI